MRMLELREAVAVVTGAASGIGRATALELARHGCHLALVDRDANGLAETTAHARAMNVNASDYLIDVADSDALVALPSRVQADLGSANILVNNAGVSMVGSFAELSVEDFRWLFDINFWAIVTLTKAFMPMMRAAHAAQIVNVSSIFGVIAPPGHTAYVASKFAIRGFSESLRHELTGSSIGVTVVHPGGINTNISRSARVGAGADHAQAAANRDAAQKPLRMPPDRAARIIVNGIRHRKKRVLVGIDAHALELFQRTLPASYWNVITALFRRQLRVLDP